MIDFIEKSTQSMIVIVAVITSFGVFGVKSTNAIDSRWLPGVSMALGAVVGAGIGLYFGDSFMGAIDGIIAGGFASGGYDFVKSLLINGRGEE